MNFGILPPLPWSAFLAVVAAISQRPSGDSALPARLTSAPRYTGGGARVGSSRCQASSWIRRASRRARSVRRVSNSRIWCSRSWSARGGLAGSSWVLITAASVTPRFAVQRYQRSLPTRHTSAPSWPQSREEALASPRVSWSSAPLRRSRTNTSPLRTKAARERVASNTGCWPSAVARAAPSSTRDSPVARSTANVSRIWLPSRLAL